MDRRQFLTQGLGLGAVALLGGAGGLPSLTPKLQWQKDLKSAHKVAVAEDKPLLLVFGAEWCTFCHKLERETLGDRKMVAFVNQHFVPVQIDFDKHRKIAEILEVESLPCSVVLSPQADLLLQFTGFAKSDGYREKLQSALDRRVEIQQAKATAEER